MIKTRSLIIGGSIIIGICFVMIVYLILISLGIIQTSANSIVIETKSLEVSYDGNEHKMEEFVLKSGKLHDGHKIVVNYSGSQTSVGESKNFADVKVVDKNENDVSRQYNININYGTIKVLKRPITFNTSDYQKIYDGTPIDSNERKLSITSGSLIRGHSVKQRVLGSFTNVGIVENRIEATIYDEKGNDVTSYYDIQYSYGLLEIQKASITVQSNSATKVYDGTPLVESGYEIINDTPVPNQHIVVDVVGSITDVGKIDNEIHVYVMDENSNDVSNNYEIHQLLGTLEILKSLYSANTLMKVPNIPNEEVVMTVLGNKTEPVYLRDLSFGNYTGLGWENATSYDFGNGINPLSYSSQALIDNNFSTNELTISFIRDNIPYLTPYFSVDNKNIGDDLHVYGPYNGQPYTTNYISYYLNASDNLYIKDPDTQIEEMKYRNYVSQTYLQIDETTKLELLKYAADGGIDKDSSSLIRDIQVLIQNSGEYNMDFAPIPDDVDNIVLYFLQVSHEGICQHFASAGVMMYRAFGIPARYVTGYLANAEKNVDTEVTNLDAHAWVEIYINGMGWIPIEVTPGLGVPPVEKTEITLVTGDYSEVYKNDYVRNKDNNNYTIIGGLMEGHHEVVEFTGQQKYTGSSPNLATIRIFDENNNDVTYMYLINKIFGKLEVTPRDIVIETATASKQPDGEGLIANQYTIVSGSLNDGEVFKDEDFIYTGVQQGYGSSDNILNIDSISIYNGGTDVTSNYNIKVIYGTLTISN